MPQLVPPTSRVRESFVAAMAEFAAEGRGSADDYTVIGADLRTHAAAWNSVDHFDRFVRSVREQALEESPRPPSRVPCTELWYVDGTEYLGRIAIRHRLTPHLREIGGHIGYDVRPSARRRGYATAMLRAALPVARDLGIDAALVTCDVANVASRKVIESNGGLFEAERGGKLLYWVPTWR
jgi:predicted acetyltransferase